MAKLQLAILPLITTDVITLCLLSFAFYCTTFDVVKVWAQVSTLLKSTDLAGLVKSNSVTVVEVRVI